VINKYPLWKNLIVLFAVTLGVLYSLPNVYLPDYAVQVSSETSGEVVSESALKVATEALDEAGIKYFGAELINGSMLVRLFDDDSQLQAKTIVQRALHDLNASYVVALNAAPTTPQWLRDLNAEPMKYGLDLRGGVHFLMEVDTESVVTERMEALETDVKRKLRDARIRYAEVDNSARGTLLVTFNSSEDRIAAQDILQSQFSEFLFTTVSNPLPGISLEITNDTIRSMEDFAVSQNVQTIRNRVNELGVAEPLVQRLGRNRIVVDLPGVQDTAEAKRILGKVATLEFRFEALPDAPRSTTVAYEYEGRNAQLERNIILRGDRVVDAQVGFDPDSGLPQVNISLDSEGGNLMHRATRNNIGRRLGVVFIETKSRDTYKMALRHTSSDQPRNCASSIGREVSDHWIVCRRSPRIVSITSCRCTGCRHVHC
jgi:preprotein translocase subunit SecD